MILHFPLKAKYTACVEIPGDKSISHRALMFNALGKGKATIKNLLCGEDVLSTVEILQALGVQIELKKMSV